MWFKGDDSVCSVAARRYGADLWLMFSLDSHAVELGLSWLAIGFVYLMYLTGGLRRQPPELTLEDAI